MFQVAYDRSVGPLRRTLLFVAGTVAGVLSITTGTVFGWVSGLALVAGSFLLVRRWWLR
jgi:hypothetical protein